MGSTHRSPRRPVVAIATVTATAMLTGWGARRLRRVVVSGTSMVPTLEPGDRLVVFRRARIGVGDLVVFPDPREPERGGTGRELVKRAIQVRPGFIEVAGDNPPASTDSRVFGEVPAGRVLGRVVYRYWPPERAGRLGRTVPAEPTTGEPGESPFPGLRLEA